MLQGGPQRLDGRVVHVTTRLSARMEGQDGERASRASREHFLPLQSLVCRLVLEQVKTIFPSSRYNTVGHPDDLLGLASSRFDVMEPYWPGDETGAVRTLLYAVKCPIQNCRILAVPYGRFFGGSVRIKDPTYHFGPFPCAILIRHLQV